eukprot:scaffold48951_cov92-Cyclotella_meneghiniana.AAC.6
MASDYGHSSRELTRKYNLEITHRILTYLLINHPVAIFVIVTFVAPPEAIVPNHGQIEAATGNRTLQSLASVHRIMSGGGCLNGMRPEEELRPRSTSLSWFSSPIFDVCNSNSVHDQHINKSFSQ